MSRKSSHVPLDTPPLDGAELPKFATRPQLAAIHARIYGPISHRTLETWPLHFRIYNGRAIASVDEFLAVAKEKFEAAPVIMGGRKSKGLY